MQVEAANQPTVYRRYRKGELPDIQIPRSSLIAPLQAVALQDPSTAKILFCSLLTAIRQEVKKKLGNDLDHSEKLNSALGSILSSSSQQERTSSSSNGLLSAVMEYLWLNDAAGLAVEPRVLAKVAKSSHLHQLGILVLENNLPVSGNDSDNGKTICAFLMKYKT